MKRFMKFVAVALVLAALLTASLTSCGISEVRYTVGLATIDTEGGQIAAFVLLNEAEQIVLCRIDEFDASDRKESSKKEQAIKSEADNSGSADEWSSQIANLERLLIGKTITELAFVKSDDAEIKANYTINIDTYVRTVAKAAAVATDSKKVISALGEVTIALTYTIDIEDDGSCLAVANGVALERGYLVAQDSIITRK